ncbi:unnamed protein product [Caenorhabditis auriculariae]|uniref:G-protein coupled receptors family 1 profile domain-containing protein n=1 Tax=Caenorhabditis auriculariae TaxID=2777116 RepID=A0A8S1H182_9PELO|nr:unnamed protein product [Caenorhabditis auriculariae]
MRGFREVESTVEHNWPHSLSSVRPPWAPINRRVIMDNGSCLNLNSELWEFRGDYSSQWPAMGVFSVLYAVIIASGIIGNVCVVLAITRNKALQTVPNMFILSLSCSDIVVCCTSATITPITAFRKEWMFGAVLCRIAPFIAGISLCFSTFTLTAISIDRYLLIRFPMRKQINHYQAFGVILLICTMAACISSPIMFKQQLGPFENFCGLYCTEDWKGNESQRKIYGAILTFLQLVIPLTIIIISYTAISLRIGQSMILKDAKRHKAEHWEVELSEQQRAAVRRRQRTNRMLIGMVVAFALSWIWSVTFNILRDYDHLPQMIKNQEYLFGIATHCIAMTSTVWNPLLYAMLNLQLRAAFIDLLPKWLRVKYNLGSDTNLPLLQNHTTMNVTASMKRSELHASCQAMGDQSLQQKKTRCDEEELLMKDQSDSPPAELALLTAARDAPDSPAGVLRRNSTMCHAIVRSDIPRTSSF